MVSIVLAALLAFAHAPADAPQSAAVLDLRCYRLMAELAGDDDPRISSAGLTGAQYFLGRIDARSPGPAVGRGDGEALAETEREQLIGQCGKVMDDAGHDFRVIGKALARAAGTV